MKYRRFLSICLLLAACGTPQDDEQDTTTICSALACAETTNVDGGEDDSNPDAGVPAQDMAELAAEMGAEMGADAGTTDIGSQPMLTATQSHEADILYGWVAAGQPSEERVAEVVATGATIISLRLQSEDPFDEPGLVDSLGGTFIRYPTMGADYDDVEFREAMYDLYDEQLDADVIVYLHCASSNRVGASWALYQAERKGVPAEEAIEMGRQAGLASLESRVRQVLGVD